MCVFMSVAGTLSRACVCVCVGGGGGAYEDEHGREWVRMWESVGGPPGGIVGRWGEGKGLGIGHGALHLWVSERERIPAQLAVRNM